MTREQVAYEIYSKLHATSVTRGFIELILMHLEEMDLIKFESKREAVIKEAEKYLSSGEGYRNDVGRYHNLIKRLVALLK